MLHYRLQEMEAELAAMEQSKHRLTVLPPECAGILDYLERDMEVRLGDKVPKDWKGWISYRRQNKQSLLILRGRAFKEGVFGALCRAGFDVPQGHDAITEYQRGFDVSPPQDLDHLLINFGLDGETFRVFLWYGENIAPYKLIFAANLDDEPYNELSTVVLESCIWVLKKPRHKTLEEFLKENAAPG
jgi:hypothetical protein